MRLSLLSALCVTSLVGCATDDDPDELLDETTQAVSCPAPAIDPARSLAVTDPQILAKFSFKRVMTRINATARSTITPLQLYQEWMSTWSACRPHVDPNGYGITCVRPESQFGAFDPFAATGPRFVPVGLFNRFDLAPANGADCGEYRIVYALRDSPGDRAFIIFEARLPNPAPAAGIAGCDGVADFWAGLSLDGDVASRATKLEAFYFKGLVAGGRTYAPVVRATSYGMGPNGAPNGKGQIRTNFFADFNEWHLRELKLRKPCALAESCKLSVVPVTVKTNPAGELFRDAHANAPAFRTPFLDQIPALSRRNPALIGMRVGNKFNEFESSAQSPEVMYANFATAGWRADIAARITNPNLTPAHILARATTQTCGGCHQLSNGADLGDGVRWPASRGFVHVDENRALSDALTTSFLPRRARVLKAFLDRRCTAGTAGTDATDLPDASEAVTVGRSALDAH